MRDMHRLIRYLAYTLEFLVLFMLQEIPGLLPPIWRVRPVLLFPAAITLALFEEDLPALFFGIGAGLLCDFGLSGLLGFHALVLGVLCFFVSHISRSFFQLNLFTACFTGVWTIALAVGAQWLFLYYFSYSQPGYAFVHHYAPKYGYTLLFLPLLYLLNRALFQALRAPDRT